MTNPALPEVVARFVPNPRPRRGDAVGELVITCPWCRKTHRHGAGSDPAHLLYGARLAHCTTRGASPSYLLVPAPTP